jgi:hypothetical protein
MAPFYALIISFALVLLLGSLLQKSAPAEPSAEPKPTPTNEEPTGDPATVTPKLVVKGAKSFPGSALTLVHGGEQTPFGGLRDVPELPSDEKYSVCAVLNDGWVAVDAIEPPGSDFSCWGPFDPTSDQPSALRVERSE